MSLVSLSRSAKADLLRRAARVMAPVLVIALAGCHEKIASGARDLWSDYPDLPDAGPAMSGYQPTPDAGVMSTAAAGSAPSGMMPPPTSESPIGPCRGPLDASEHVPQRDVTMSADARPAQRAMFTRDLFDQFESLCGDCHGTNADSTFSIGDIDPNTQLYEFADRTADYQDMITQSIKSDDQTVVMPSYDRYKLTWSDRLKRPNDPVVLLEAELEAWFDQGSPNDLFYMNDDGSGDMSMPPYTMSEMVGSQLTNMGSCMPDKRAMYSNASKSDAMDEFFKGATALPSSLDQTDLVSFDSDVLARVGVVSYVPAYPLYSDDSYKVRHVRAPHGQSIHFDKAKQEFEIPANTRFYKTFLKKVIQSDGTVRWRKMETRLIVSRPDGPDGTDGSHQVNSLFGTYAWDDNEVTATLVTDPLRNGTPFRDRLTTYVTDESKAQAVLNDANVVDKVVGLQQANATRTYAIPGSARCMQCHMGSHSHSFVVGFTPLQIKRRATGEGGTYEATGADEINQLQQLIDFGVISGIDSPDDVLPLEQSEGDRKPRNDYELKAQAYMLGNCANCHNPRGYPSVVNPPLRPPSNVNFLDFFPDSSGGGIFQFPLDRTSPRILRGDSQDEDIPYITPSLLDIEPRSPDTLHPARHTPVSAMPNTDYYLAAPWRSLIFRNVHEPSPDALPEDGVIYPHMPMNAVGFDTRAPQILGDWMVSIPARLRSDLSAHVVAGTPPDVAEAFATVQPYEEVLPTDQDYQAALADAKQRLDAYHNGGPAPVSYFQPGTQDSKTVYLSNDYTYCGQDTTNPPDIVRHPLPDCDQVDDTDPRFLANFGCGCPSAPTLPRPDWIVTDITDLPPPWYPRRVDWASVLVDKQVDVGIANDPTKANLVLQEKTVIDQLQSVTLNQDLRDFVAQTIPFALWKEKTDCAWKGVRKVSDIAKTDQWQWMSDNSTQAGGHVYDESYGEAVFNEICVNCHGPNYDSRGRMADLLMLQSGGKTRVANFRDGLFGPVDKPGDYRAAVFGPKETDQVTGDDWAARYMAWMGLGGTKAKLVGSVLVEIQTTAIFGTKRPNVHPNQDGIANMLEIARQACLDTLGHGNDTEDPSVADFGSLTIALKSGALGGAEIAARTLIDQNADAEMWKRLCAFQNTRPVAVTEPFSKLNQTGNTLNIVRFYRAAALPAGSTVGDQNGHLTSGVTPQNYFPWCIPNVTDPTQKQALDMFVQDQRNGTPLPICPASWMIDNNRMNQGDLLAWGLRGAINAGLAVFLYLDDMSKNQKTPQPPWDSCDLLPN